MYYFLILKSVALYISMGNNSLKVGLPSLLLSLFLTFNSHHWLLKMVYFILKWFIIFGTDATTVLVDVDSLNEKNVYRWLLFSINIKKGLLCDQHKKESLGFLVH